MDRMARFDGEKNRLVRYCSSALRQTNQHPQGDRVNYLVAPSSNRTVRCAQLTDSCPTKWLFSTCPMSPVAKPPEIGHLEAMISVNMVRLSGIDPRASYYCRNLTFLIEMETLSRNCQLHLEVVVSFVFVLYVSPSVRPSFAERFWLFPVWNFDYFIRLICSLRLLSISIVFIGNVSSFEDAFWLKI